MMKATRLMKDLKQENNLDVNLSKDSLLKV